MANNINKFLDKAGLTRLISWIKGALNSKQDKLTFDTTPTTDSRNPVTSGGVKAAIDALGTPNEIASITTQESSASGGNNVVTITDTDGTVTTFNVKNGQDGADGVSLGEIALVQTTGDSEESVMSQKAVTEHTERLTKEDLEAIAYKLPEGYQMLDYISNGDTKGTNATDGARIKSEIIPDDPYWKFVGSWSRNGGINAFGAIISCYTAEAAAKYRIIADNTNTSKLLVDAYSKVNKQVNLGNTAINIWHTYELSYNSIILDGVATTIGTIAGSNITADLLIGDARYPQKIGPFKAYHNGKLVAFLIPCKHKSEVGMYDIVRNKMYTSYTEYDFIAGEVVNNYQDNLLSGKGLADLITNELGNSESKVVSQACVSEKVQRIDMDSLDSTTEQIKQLLLKEGWILDAGLHQNGGTVKNNTKVFYTSPYILIDEILNHNVTIRKGNVQAVYVNCYDENKILISGANVSNNPYTFTFTNSALSSARYIRVSFDETNLRTCFLLDNTTGEYIIKMDDYLDQLFKNASLLVDYSTLREFVSQDLGDSEFKTISQKTVTNELTAVQVVKPSYFTGIMLTYLLEDYPMFDIRKCDGVSIVMDAIQLNLGRSAANFVISKGVSTNADPAFYINQVWGNLMVGLYKSYDGTAVQGVSVNNGNNAYFSHRVYTVNFLTGVCKVYKNGVLVNTLTPSSYDYSVLKDFFDNTATRLSIGPGTRDAQLKTSSMAIFGNVLTDDDVTDLYGNGSDSVCGNLIPDKWKANWLVPHIITNWGTEHYNATKTTHADGGAIFTTNSTSDAYLRFGFTGIPLTGENAVRGNIIYEWDFEVLSGSANAHYSMRNGSYAYKSWKIIDSEGNELEDGTLVEAGNTYHVINKPDNLMNNYYDSIGTSLHLGYVFDNPSTDFSIWVKPELKLTERGAAIVCGPDEYKDVYWEMPNGTHIPNNKTLKLQNVLGHNTLPITQGVHYGGFKDKAVIYSSSKLPQFNGQIAVDTTNGKVYIGYLTGTGGTWKQVSN